MSANFVTKEGASPEEIQAVVARGYEAMMNGATDVAFFINRPSNHNQESSLEPGVPTKKHKVNEGEEHNVLNNAAILEVVKDIVPCPGFEEQPSLELNHHIQIPTPPTPIATPPSLQNLQRNMEATDNSYKAK